MDYEAFVKAATERLEKIAMDSGKWIDAKRLSYLKGVLHEIFLRSR